jgi:hypothetical protein
VIVVSPPGPTPLGVNVAEQLAKRPVPCDRAHESALKLPGPLDVKLTVPVGVFCPPPAVSDTFTVHLVACLTVTLPGAQFTLVDVDRIVGPGALTVTVTVVVLLLASWPGSPP